MKTPHRTPERWSPAGLSRLAEEAIISLEAKHLPLIPNTCSWQWSVMGQWHSQQQAGVQKPGQRDWSPRDHSDGQSETTDVSPSPCSALPRARAGLTSPAWGQPQPALSPTLFFPIRKDALFQRAHQPARKINGSRHWLRDEDPHPPIRTIISTLKSKEQFSQYLQIALLCLWSISFLSAPSDDIDANKRQRRRWRERPMY